MHIIFLVYTLIWSTILTAFSFKPVTIAMLTVIDRFYKIGHKLVLLSRRDGHQVIAKGGAVRLCSRPGACAGRENVAGARVHGAILT